MRWDQKSAALRSVAQLRALEERDSRLKQSNRNAKRALNAVHVSGTALTASLKLALQLVRQSAGKRYRYRSSSTLLAYARSGTLGDSTAPGPLIHSSRWNLKSSDSARSQTSGWPASLLAASHHVQHRQMSATYVWWRAECSERADGDTKQAHCDTLGVRA